MPESVGQAGSSAQPQPLVIPRTLPTRTADFTDMNCGYPTDFTDEANSLLK